MSMDIVIYPGCCVEIPSNPKRWAKSLEEFPMIKISDVPMYTDSNEKSIELIIGGDEEDFLAIGLPIDIAKKLIRALTISLEAVEGC